MSHDGKIIVFSPGTWDMFHVGHLNLLRSARGFGNTLIVGVKTDELVREQKGHYPLLSYDDRAAVVAACRYVDVVVPLRDSKREELLEKLDVDILVVGDDWWERKAVGHDFMISRGRRVVYVPYTEGRSSTALREAIDRYYCAEHKMLDRGKKKSNQG